MKERELTTFEAASALGVSVRTVQQWVEKGVLTGRKTTGGHRRISAGEVQALLENRRQKEKASGSCRVLVIEDDPDICRLYELMCNSWSFKVDLRFARDGLQGLIEYGAFRPNFTIIDLNIPMIDGYQLIQALVSRNPASIGHICVVTATDPELVKSNGELPGQVPVFGKPVDFNRLEQLALTASTADYVALESEA